MYTQLSHTCYHDETVELLEDEEPWIHPKNVFIDRVLNVQVSSEDLSIQSELSLVSDCSLNSSS